MVERDTYTVVKSLLDLLIQRATGLVEGNDLAKNAEYIELRAGLLNSPSHLPDIVKNCLTLDQFWRKIKEIDTYEQRRKYLDEIFVPVIVELEQPSHPSDEIISNALGCFDLNDVSPLWTKALLRRESDPAGAVTLARSLLESTCKKILLEMNTSYNENDLPKLYKIVAGKLNLSPEGHSEILFKQILGSCQNIVESLGAIRNIHSDSHAQPKSFKPAIRHAELAVNLAGTMSAFLVATWNAQKTKVT